MPERSDLDPMRSSDLNEQGGTMRTPMRSHQSCRAAAATGGTPSRKRCISVIAAIAAIAAIAGCGGTTTGSQTVTAASTVASHQYTSVHFRVPLTISTDVMKTPPTEDSSNFISWDAIVPGGVRSGGGQYNAVRLLVPAKVYRPNSDVAIKPPKRYLQFLLAQKAYGAKISDVTNLTIDGRSATIMTATTRVGLDGAIGCPTSQPTRRTAALGSSPTSRCGSRSSTLAVHPSWHGHGRAQKRRTTACL
jgi:hypothetical protein